MTPFERFVAGIELIKPYVKAMNTYHASCGIAFRCSLLSDNHEKQLQALGFEISFHDRPPDECGVRFEEDGDV